MATNFAYAASNDGKPLVSNALVADYKNAHENMLAAITALDELAAAPMPTRHQCPEALASGQRVLVRRLLIAAFPANGPKSNSSKEAGKFEAAGLASITHPLLRRKDAFNCHAV